MKTYGGSDQSMDEDVDEEELEALRLAALESLRAKGLPPPPSKPQKSPIQTRVRNLSISTSFELFTSV